MGNGTHPQAKKPKSASELPRFLWDMPYENEKVGRVVFYIEDKAFCVPLVAKR